MKRSILLFVLTAVTLCLHAQDRQERQYLEAAAAVKKEVWSGNDPHFKVSAVPDSLKDESAVILARSIRLSLDLHKQLRIGVLAAAAPTVFSRSVIIRERVKIQDKAALADYSELSFQKLKKTRAYLIGRENSLVFVGAKIIKADGQTRELDMSDAVNIRDKKRDKAQKVAIPGLQVGDILDYYIKVEEEKDAAIRSADPFDEPFEMSVGDQYPMLNFSFHASAPDRFGVYYKWLNAPDNELHRAHTGDQLFFSLKRDYTPKVADELWLYEKRALPTLKMDFLPGEKRASFDYYPEPGEILNGLTEPYMQNTAFFECSGLNYPFSDQMISMIRDFNKYLKQYKKQAGNEDMTAAALTRLLFYYARFEFLYKERNVTSITVGPQRNLYTPRLPFLRTFLMELLEEHDIPFSIFFGMPRSEGALTDAVSMDEMNYWLAAYPDGSREPLYLCLDDMFSRPGEIPVSLEGQEVYRLVLKPRRKTVPEVIKMEKIRLPVSSAASNTVNQQLSVTLDGKDPQLLNINRDITATGLCRYAYQPALLLYQDMEKEERHKLKLPSTFEEDLRKNNSQRRNIADEYEAAFRKARTGRKEIVKAAIEDEYSISPQALASYKILNQGLGEERPDFHMQESFSLKGLVRKAGNNYILDIGRLIGNHIELNADGHHRTHDIYLPYARNFQYKLSLAVPAGYTVAGLENLKKQVSNETGCFISSAEMKGNTVVVTVKKAYAHHYEPVANWDKMTAFLDAASDFTRQKILLKKM